jgi:hypothetical protein
VTLADPAVAVLPIVATPTVDVEPSTMEDECNAVAKPTVTPNAANTFALALAR